MELCFVYCFVLLSDGFGVKSPLVRLFSRLPGDQHHWILMDVQTKYSREVQGAYLCELMELWCHRHLDLIVLSSRNRWEYVTAVDKPLKVGYLRESRVCHY